MHPLFSVSFQFFVFTLWVCPVVYDIPRWVPSFLYQYPWKFLERLRIAPKLVSSKETGLPLRDTKNLTFGFTEFLGDLFSHSAYKLLRSLCDKLLINSRSVCVSRDFVPRMLLLKIPVDCIKFSLLHGKRINSSENWITFDQLLLMKWNSLEKYVLTGF